jgi:hypothetical protein
MLAMKMIVRFCCGLLLFFVHGLVLAAPEQLTSSMANADYADVRTDVSGNTHLVWTADDATDGRAVFYKMLNSSGAVLIDDTRIDNGGTGGPAGYPSMVMDGSSKVYVVWQSGASPEIYFLRLNPLADALDGSSADITDPLFKEIGDVVISAAGGDSAMHPRVDIDSSADLHVVWESNCTGPVQYTKVVDADGVPVIGAPQDLGPAGSCNGYPDIALDSNADAHMVFANSTITTADEIYYAMIDGAAGTVLIDATLMSVDDGLLAGSATISADTGHDKVIIVYKQETGVGGPGSEEIFIAILDPALDNRDGSSADPSVLRVNLLQFTSGEGQFRWQVFSRIGLDRRLHILFMDIDDTACPSGVYALEQAHVTTTGEVLVRGTLSSTASAQSCAAQARLAPRGNRIVWADSASGSQEIVSSTFTRADAGESGYFTCALRPVSGSAAGAGDLWLLLAGIGALGLRYLSRRRAVQA